MRRPAVLLAVLLLASCGRATPSARLGGDVGGVPVRVTVVYDRAALPALAQGGGFTRTIVVERDPWPDPYWHPYRRPWYGPSHAYEPATDLWLLVGDGPAEAQLLRARLVAGTWSWTVPMQPGRTAHVAIQASGGREGWRAVGSFTAAEGVQAVVHLEGPQPRLEVGGAAVATPPSAEASPPAR